MPAGWLNGRFGEPSLPKTKSRQTPDPALLSRRSVAKTDDVQPQASVAQDLELLADSCPVLFTGLSRTCRPARDDYRSCGMEFFQFALESINGGGREFRLVETAG
jgi:hypothetical protein